MHLRGNNPILNSVPLAYNTVILHSSSDSSADELSDPELSPTWAHMSLVPFSRTDAENIVLFQAV